MLVYMAVSNDVFELPLYVTLYPSDLAEKMGITERQFKDLMRHRGNGKHKKAIDLYVVKVEIEDE